MLLLQLSFIFDFYLTFSDQVSSVSRACFYHIRDLRRIRPVLDFDTAHTTVHSRLSYCTSMQYCLPKLELNRLYVHSERFCSCCFLQLPGPMPWPFSQVSALVQGRRTRWISSSTLLLHVTCAISYSFLDQVDHARIFSNCHQLTPVSGSQTVLVDTLHLTCGTIGSSYSWCTLSVWCMHHHHPSLLHRQVLLLDRLWTFSRCFHSRLKTFLFSRSFPHSHLSPPHRGVATAGHLLCERPHVIVEYLQRPNI